MSFGLCLKGRKGEKPRKIKTRILHPPMPTPACYPTAYRFLCATQGSNSCLKQSPVLKAEFMSGDAFWRHMSWFSWNSRSSTSYLTLMLHICCSIQIQLLMGETRRCRLLGKSWETILFLFGNFPEALLVPFSIYTWKLILFSPY